MKVRSLGCRTDLIFPAYDGEILDRGEYLVIRTSTSPDFYWGNYLLFQDPPRDSDHLRWPELFAREIGTPPEVVHQTFAWDTPSGEGGAYEPFLRTGFRLERSSVLTARSVHAPARGSEEVEVRPLLSEEEWEQSVDNQVACREAGFSEAAYGRFRRAQMTRYRAMSADELGAWYGAFLGSQLVADLGIFHQQELGRYQSVQTHPEFRRRGIAATLVHQAGLDALRRFDLDTLVIAAEEGSSAARVYTSVGFQPVERTFGLEKW